MQLHQPTATAFNRLLNHGNVTWNHMEDYTVSACFSRMCKNNVGLWRVHTCTAQWRARALPNLHPKHLRLAATEGKLVHREVEVWWVKFKSQVNWRTNRASTAGSIYVFRNPKKQVKGKQCEKMSNPKLSPISMENTKKHQHLLPMSIDKNRMIFIVNRQSESQHSC